LLQRDFQEGSFGLWQVNENAALAGDVLAPGWGREGGGRASSAVQKRAILHLRKMKKAAPGGLLLLVDFEGIFFFTPYYQNTKSSTKTGQIRLGVLACKSRGILSYYFGFFHILLTNLWNNSAGPT
jgi:hypothetical protein